jgi:hypothetical protein
MKTDPELYVYRQHLERCPLVGEMRAPTNANARFTLMANIMESGSGGLSKHGAAKLQIGIFPS